MRSSDLLSLQVSDVVTESGKVKTEVRVKQKKTGKFTLNIPLSKNSINSIKKHTYDTINKIGNEFPTLYKIRINNRMIDLKPSENHTFWST